MSHQCISAFSALMPLTVSCFSKIQIGFTFLVLADLDSPGKGPLNGCVCVCVILRSKCQILTLTLWLRLGGGDGEQHRYSYWYDYTFLLCLFMFQWTGGPCPFYIFNASPMNSSSDCMAASQWTSAAAAGSAASSHQILWIALLTVHPKMSVAIGYVNFSFEAGVASENKTQLQVAAVLPSANVSRCQLRFRSLVAIAAACQWWPIDLQDMTSY